MQPFTFTSVPFEGNMTMTHMTIIFVAMFLDEVPCLAFKGNERETSHLGFCSPIWMQTQVRSVGTPLAKDGPNSELTRSDVSMFGDVHRPHAILRLRSATTRGFGTGYSLQATE